MIVCDCTYGIFVMFIEKDICVIIIPFDKVVADEIISKAHNYMRQIMLPQLLFEHYVKSNNVSALSLKESVNIELVISDLNLEVPSVTEMEVELSNQRANQSYLICCQNDKKRDEETVTCSNISCVVSTFHKNCVVPPRKRFSKNWMC